MSKELICKLNGISKIFPGVRALDNVSFDIYSGEVHAVVGENGAGKSTLMNILSGVYPADEGTCLLYTSRNAGKLFRGNARGARRQPP